MAFICSSHEHDRDFTRDEGYRNYLITRDVMPADAQPGALRFKWLAVHARHTVHRIDGFIARSIDMLADAKLRRLHGELAMNGAAHRRGADASGRLRVSK